MGGLDHIDDKSVNTEKIVSIFRDHFTKVVNVEPEKVVKAIENLQKLMRIETPRYVKGKERTFDNTGKETYHGEEEKILYQFDPRHKAEFDSYVIDINLGMAVIPNVIVHYRDELKKHRDLGTPLSLPVMPRINPPEIDKKPSVLERINPFPRKEEKRDQEDLEMQTLINQTKELAWRWPNFLEWWYGSYKYDTDRGTWSDLLPRYAMEQRLTRYQEFFDYWISYFFLQTYKYAMDLEFKRVKEDAIRFVESLASVQNRHEQQNPFQQ